MPLKINLTDKRNHKIKSDYGIADYFKYYQSKGGKLDRMQFRKVLYTFNKNLYPVICSDGYEYKIPKRLGCLASFQKKSYVDIDKEGNLRTNRQIDWDSTLKLWEQYPELRGQKQYVRFENEKIFSIKYTKKNANFRNKTIYCFRINREFKQFVADFARANPTFKTRTCIWK